MKNLVSKTAVKALLIVIIALALLFGVASLGFPSQMASLFEKMGGYSFATGYAKLAYSYSDTCANLARCVDDSIFAGDERNTVVFGEQLVGRDDFNEYCAERNASMDSLDYRQFVYGNIAVAHYELGDSDAALKTSDEAMSGVVGFPSNNAYTALALAARNAGDASLMDALYGRVSSIIPLSSAEEENRSAVMAILTGKN